MSGFVHIEIPTRDIKRAKTFYGKIFGWTFLDYGKGYSMFQVPGGGVGGALMKVKKVPAKPAIQAYIGVDDLDAKLKAIRSARGKVLKPKAEVPDMGWWASFKDNQGTVLFLWQTMPKAGQTGLPM